MSGIGVGFAYLSGLGGCDVYFSGMGVGYMYLSGMGVGYVYFLVWVVVTCKSGIDKSTEWSMV